MVGAAHDLVGDGLALRDPGDLFHDVVQRLEVLDVQIGDDVDAGFEHLLDVLPALLVPAPRHVGVRQLIDERQGGPAREDRVEVHLLEDSVPILQGRAGNDLEVSDLVGRPSAPMRLDEADDDILAAREAPAALVQHRVRLADAGRSAEVDTQRTAAHAALR